MSSIISSSTAAPATTTATTATAATTPAAASASATVTSQGIGSGLNISAIVSSLTTAYGAAKQNQLTNQETALDSQLSAFGTFQSSLDTLQGTLSALETPSKLAGYDAAVADKTVATASATSAATAGTYTIGVTSLATTATLTSGVVASSSTAVGTGTLNISVGGSSAAITIDATNNTLAGIASAINGASDNPGVSASVISTTDGARLILSGTATGAANAVTVTETDGGTGLASLVYDPTSSTPSQMTQTQAAADANFTINGYPATSPSNVVSTAISGVTLNLVGASASGTTTTLSVTPDTTAAQTAITNFITALNSTLTSVQTLTAYNAATQTAGALQGNATLEAFQNQLSSILDTVKPNNPGGVTSLSYLGITADASTGTLDTATQTLTDTLTASLGSVGTLLGGANGLATQVDSLITQYTKSGGILSEINTGLQQGLTSAATAQTALTAELATYSATLTTQYNAMDTAIAALKETQTYLNAEFNPSANNTSSAATSSLSSGTTSTS